MRSVNQALVLFVVSVCSVLSAEIPVTQIKGLASPLKSEYEHLSPVWGALLFRNNYVENIYRYGWQNGESTSSTVKLIKELFHVHFDNVTFDATYLPTKVATHFTPRTIGRMIGHIEAFKRDYQAEQGGKKQKISAQKYLKLKSVDSLKKGIATEIETLEKENEVAINKKIEEYAQDDRVKKTFQELKDIYWKRRKSYTMFRGSLATAVIEQVPFHSSIAGIENKAPVSYISDNVTFILLSFLWKKAAKKKDFYEFFRGIRDVLEGVSFREDGFAREEKEPERFLEEQFDGNVYKELSKTAPGEIGIITTDLEKLAFLHLAFDLYKNPLPPLVGMIGDAQHGDVSFADCGETSVRNFFNAVLYDPKKQEFDVSILKKIEAKKELIKYYEDYKTTEKIRTDQSHHDWAGVVSALPDVGYFHEDGACEINPGIKNMLVVLKRLLNLGEATFDAVVKKFESQVKVSYRVDKEPLRDNDTDNSIEFTIDKPDYAVFVTEWLFQKNHFEVKFPKRKKQIGSVAACIEKLKAETSKTSSKSEKNKLVVISGIYDPVDTVKFLRNKEFDSSYGLVAFYLTDLKTADFVLDAVKFLLSQDCVFADLLKIKTVKRIYSALPEEDRYTQERFFNMVFRSDLEIFDIKDDVFKDMGLLQKIIVCASILKTGSKNDFAQKEGLAVATKGIHAERYLIRDAALDLFKAFFKTGKGFDEAITVALSGAMSGKLVVRSGAQNLLEALFNEGRGSEKVIAAAQEKMAIDDAKIQFLALDLFIVLVKNGLGFKEAIEAGHKGMMSKDYNVQSTALGMFEILFEKHKEFEEVEEAAKVGLSSEHRGVQFLALNLFKGFFEIDNGFKKLMDVVIRAEQADDKSTRILFKELVAKLKELIQERRSIDDAVYVATRGVNIDKPFFQSNAPSLFEVLFLKGYGFEQARALTRTRIGAEAKYRIQMLLRKHADKERP